MIEFLKPYQRYKESAVERLGEVPAHWQIRRLRNIARFRFSNVDKHVKDGEKPIRLLNYTDVYHNDRIHSDMDFMQATATTEEVNRFRLVVGDVLITKDSEVWNDIGVPALVESSDTNLICGYHLAQLRPVRGKLQARFLHAALSCSRVAIQFHIRANGVTRFGLSQDSIKAVWLPVPPNSEQIAITHFLDHATDQIDRLVQANEKLIELLGELKQATIHEAVSGRIDVRTGKPYSNYKESGVDWLGEVPVHWDVPRLKTIATVVMGQSPSSEDCNYDSVGLPFLQGCAEFGKTHPDPIQYCRTPSKTSPPGSLLLSVRAPVGKINLSDHRYGIGRGLCAIVSSPNVPAKFTEFMLRAASSALVEVATGSTYDAVTIGGVGNLRVVHPPPVEQIAITHFLDHITNQIENAFDATTKKIELLKEYRTRLIADVVMGKVDVRAAAANLPDFKFTQVNETNRSKSKQT